MILISPDFKSGQPIPKDHTGDGKDVSPALLWKEAPKETKSFALIMDDPDAPPGTWVHWILYDLPATERTLPRGVPKTAKGPAGSKHGACWGVDTFDRLGYFGPLPPPGAPHRYFFKLYALGETLGLKPGATKDELLEAMKGHVLAQAELMGTYRR